VLVDNTGSMKIEDAPDCVAMPPTRFWHRPAWTRSRSTSARSSCLRWHLAKAESETLSFAEEGTNLRRQPQGILQRYEDKNLAGILLVTDGSPISVPIRFS